MRVSVGRRPSSPIGHHHKLVRLWSPKLRNTGTGCPGRARQRFSNGHDSLFLEGGFVALIWHDDRQRHRFRRAAELNDRLASNALNRVGDHQETLKKQSEYCRRASFSGV